MPPRHIFVAVASPYASRSLHLGHLEAPTCADIFTRYHRLAGNRVLMVSGSDAHGTPITVEADQESTTPGSGRPLPPREILGYLRESGISFDLFTTTMTETTVRSPATSSRTLRGKGRQHRPETSIQFYDPEAERFAPTVSRREHAPIADRPGTG